ALGAMWLPAAGGAEAHAAGAGAEGGVHPDAGKMPALRPDAQPPTTSTQPPTPNAKRSTLNAQSLEAKLGTIGYAPAKQSHIRVFWPEHLTEKQQLRDWPLWHLCPAGVYELAGDGAARPVIHAENCIKCECCWRASDTVDWGRTRSHRMIYDPPTGAKCRLWEQMEDVGDP